MLTGEMFDRLVSNDTDKLRWIKEAVEQLKYYRRHAAGGSGGTDE